MQIGGLQFPVRTGFVIDNPDLLPGETGRVILREHQIDLAAQLKLHAIGNFHRTFATDGQLRRHPIPLFRRSDFGAEVPREIARIQPARDPPIRDDFACQAAKAPKCRTLLVRGKADALVDLCQVWKSGENFSVPAFQ